LQKTFDPIIILICAGYCSLYSDTELDISVKKEVYKKTRTSRYSLGKNYKGIILAKFP